jgi:phosphoglycerate kinase
MHAAKERHCEVLLPHDVVVAERLEADAPARVVPTLAVPADQKILDVGPKTVAHYADVIAGAKTLLWNGPLGAFEIKAFAGGTIELARAVAKLTKAGRLVSVAGGGDTVAALNAAGVTGDFSYVSTAGGAFLEWLEGRELPGIVALTEAG